MSAPDNPAAAGAPVPRVLLVDDNPDDRALVRRTLRQALGAVEPVEALDETDLARTLREGDIDLVVTDYQIRWTTGRAVLEQWKARHPEVPVVMFTGSGSEQLAADLLTAGLDDYVVKNAKYESRLAAAVRSAMERRRAERRAATLEARLAAILERLDIGVFRCTPDAVLLEANPAFLHLLGAPDLQAARRLDLRFLLCEDESRHAWRNRHGGEREYVECEYEHVLPDGATRQLRITATRTLEDDGDAKREVVEGMVKDVSDRRRLEAQLRQAQKMEAVGLLAGGIAHDFNNILTAIIGGLSLLSRHLRAQPALEREAADIQQAALRAADLTSQLLAFSRRQPLRLRPVDPNEVVRSIHRLLGRVIGESITVELALDPGVRHAWADPSQLEQVLLNLAINARDAMPRGGTLTIETGNVELDARFAAERSEVRPGSYVLLAVSDTGMGMDRATLARIFEPFFTTKSSGQGTGLGLSTVYGVVKQSGGHVAAYSEPGHGSSFKVYLPVAEERPASAEPSPAAPAAAGGGTVLVAEDEPLVREIARRVLEEAGYRVLVADGGDSALALAADTHAGGGRIDLLLTDVVMPGMSGPELAQQLQRSDPGLRVVFMSGYPAQAVAHHGVHAPGEHFLQKPFQPDALVAHVADALRR